MKFSKIYGCLFAAAMMLASCESSQWTDTPDVNDSNVISITGVSLTGFVADASSRAIYSDTYATRFEEGDRLGLVLIGSDGSQTANVPFSYTAEGKWNNDLNQLYSSDVTRVIAYFPYNPSLPAAVTDVAGVKNSVNIAADQSDIEAFTAADLLVCEVSNPGADISVAFSHAFSMLRFSSKASVTAGGRDFEYSVALEGLKITLGNEVYTPCYMNGGYVMIIKDATLLQPELFKYAYRRFGEDMATKTLTGNVTTTAGTAFSFPCPPAGTAPSGLTAGDYYCVTESDGLVVIIPAGASAIPDGLVCQGIVFHVMDNAAFTAFAADNGLAAAEYPGLGGKHGLIVSLRQGGLLLSGYNPGDVSNSDFLKSVFADFEGSGNTDVSLGYRLTGMLSAAYGSGNAGVTFSALDGFDSPLTYCTDWYVPSFNELKYLIRGGETPNTVSLAGQEMINRHMTVVSGVLLEGNMPSVSYKPNEGFCIMQNGEEMGWHGVPDGEKCRPVCAF